MSALPHASIAADLYRTYINIMRPSEYILPSVWAEKYRHLPEGQSECPGPWRNDYYPYITQIQDSCAEAINTGKNVVVMKSAQGGGSESMINVLFWLLKYYPGPTLYLISTKDMAQKFGRERFNSIIDTISYLKALELPGRRSMLVKYFAGFKITLSGGQSVFSLQSEPYRHVFVDEPDSFPDVMGETGDPLAIAQQRQSSYRGLKLTTAFAHPTSKSRGAGYLYWNLSDQRRAFVTCPHEGCNHEFYLQWSHVKAAPRNSGQLQEHADRDPHCYSYYCPSCGAEISDAQRWTIIRKLQYRSILPPEEAAKRTWIGLHFSQLYYPNKSILELARQYVASMDKETERIVFVQKTLGECYEPTVKSTTISQWRRLCVNNWLRGSDDPEMYMRGQIPRGVQYLTGAVDSRDEELHWVIWGWGLRRTITGATTCCGWLIDYGIVKRPSKNNTFIAQDYLVFNDIMFNKQFIKTNGERLIVEQCAFDTGYPPTQMPVHHYCREHIYRAIPIKGGADTSKSSSPFMRNGNPLVYTYHGHQIKDEALKLLNTYTLKTDFLNMVDAEIVVKDGEQTRKFPLILLPKDEGESEFDTFLKQSSAEKLKFLAKKNYMKWVKESENHFGDCNVYNYALSKNLNPYARPLPFDEIEVVKDAEQRNALEAQNNIPMVFQNEALNRYQVSEGWLQ